MADAAPEWEVSKENFQPLKAGRSARGLGTPKKEVPRAALAETEARRKQYEQELQSYTGDDPLEVWSRYIKWVQEAYRMGGAKAELVPLLERCTRELEAVPRYRGDHRYLRIWIQYADHLPDPQEVFTYLQGKDIGQEQALFYTAYATFLEMRGAHSRARGVFQGGLAKYAAPLDQLRRKYDEFEHRMVRREERRARGEAAPAEMAAGAVSRTTFGELPTRARARARAGPATRPPRAGLAATRPAPAADAENAAPATTASGDLGIFVDPEFGGADEGPAYQAPRSTLEHLATFEAGRKENTMAPAPWAGQQLPQRRGGGAAGAGPPPPALDIPQDDELVNAPAPPSDAQQKPLRRQLEGGAGLQHVLEADPLRLHTAPPPGPAQQPVPAAQPAGRAQQPATTPQRRQREAKETVLAYDAAALNQPGSGAVGGEELSFEELRAAHRRRLRATAAGTAVDTTVAGGSGSARAPAAAADAGMSEAAAAAISPAADGAGGAEAATALQQADRTAQGRDMAPQGADLPAGRRSSWQPGDVAEVPTAMNVDAVPASGVGTVALPTATGAGSAAAGKAPGAAATKAHAAAEADVASAQQTMAGAAAMAAGIGSSVVCSPPAATESAPAAQAAADIETDAAAGAGSVRQASALGHVNVAAAAVSPVAPASGKRKRGLAQRPAAANVPQPPAGQPAAPAAAQAPASPTAAAEAEGSIQPAASPPTPASPAGDDGSNAADLEDTFLGAFAGPVLEQAASASMPEPTVTANTREAWAAINGMFSSALPHESGAAVDMALDAGSGPVAAAAAAARPPLPRRSSMGAGGRRSSAGGAAGNPFATAAAARARRSRRSSILPSAFTQPTVIREDTEYLSFGDGAGAAASNAAASTLFFESSGGGNIAAPTSAAAAEDTGPLPMYEDTQFLDRGPASGQDGQQAAGALASAAVAGSAAGRVGGGFGGDDTGLLIREDTCCLPDAPVAAASAALQQQTGGLQLYEDTGFLTENMAPQSAAAPAVTSQALPAAAATIGVNAAAAAEATGGLQLYEDTGFLTENMAPQSAAAPAVTSQALPAPAATIDVSAAAAAEATGGLQLYEDTGFLTENMAPRAAAPATTSQALPAAAGILGIDTAAASDSGGLQLYEDTGFLPENVAPVPTTAAAVSLQALPAAAATTIGGGNGGQTTAAANWNSGLRLRGDGGFPAEVVAQQPEAAAPAANDRAPADEEEEFDGEAENQPPVGMLLPPLASAVAPINGQKPPLQVLSDARAAACGIEIGDGLPSDADEDAVPPAVTLAQAGSDLQDDFVVHRNM